MTTPTEIAARYNLRHRSGRYAGPCPKCGGSQTSDKFVLREDGGFKCYGCDFKGDAITWLREMEGMSCPEAHASAGKCCETTGCPAYDTCRMGKGERTKGPRRPASVTLPPVKRDTAIRTAAVRDPADLWRSWASPFQQRCADELLCRADVLAWLSARGIDCDTTEAAGLGYNATSHKLDRAGLGLPPEKDGKTALWIPAGLVIPTSDAKGHILRLRIRRPDDDRQRFLPDLKYVWIEGSGTDLLLIPASTTPARGLVVIEAELDAIATAAAHTGVDVLALGTVSAVLSPELVARVKTAPVVLVALDADSERTTSDGRTIAPGRDAARTWCATYRHARFWPVPAGKDPGDYAGQGGNLYAWIEAGLAPSVAAVKEQMDEHAKIPMRLIDESGGRGDGVVVLLRGVTDKGSPWAIVNRIAQDCPTIDDLEASGVAVFAAGDFGFGGGVVDVEVLMRKCPGWVVC